MRRELWRIITKPSNSSPTWHRSYINRGVLELSTDYAGAMADYDRAIELKPDFHEAYNSRGEARRVNGQLDAAMADFGKAIELKPDFSPAYNNRAIAKSPSATTPARWRIVTRRSASKLDHPVYFVNRGEVKRHLQDLSGAMADFDRAIELKPDGLTYSLRALIKHTKEDLEGALSDCERGFSLPPIRAWSKRVTA